MNPPVPVAACRTVATGFLRPVEADRQRDDRHAA